MFLLEDKLNIFIASVLFFIIYKKFGLEFIKTTTNNFSSFYERIYKNDVFRISFYFFCFYFIILIYKIFTEIII